MIDKIIRTAVAHHQAGRLGEAAVIYRQVLQQEPNHPDVLHLLGLVVSAFGHADEAIALISRAARINPANALYHSNLGVAYRDCGRIDEAIMALNQALKIRPDYAEALSHLGNALRDAGQHDAAIAAYRRAILLKPNFSVARSNLGSALRDIGALDEAIAEFRAALRFDPSHAPALRNLGNALNERGELDEGIQCLQQAVALSPLNHEVHSSLLFAMMHHPLFEQADIHREFRAWAQRYAAPLAATADAPQTDASPDRQLKVAYLSKYFCDSAEIHYLLPLIANHDRERFQISLYSDVVRTDEWTVRARALADHWHSVAGLSDAQLAVLIRQHQIDIAVMIGHHSPGNRLLAMARKPAPVSLTWLFSGSSTGLTEIDYRVSDPHVDALEQSESCSSETTLQLSDTAWCYDPLMQGMPVSPLPAIQTGFVTFGSLNRLWKISNAVVDLWCKVLHATEGSQLCLLAPQGRARQRMLDLFATRNIEPGRIHFVARQPRRDYLQTYHRIDIALDPFPYDGHTTSLDALWMGVPVVTLTDRPPVGRVGISLLSNLGLTQCAAETGAEYVAAASGLAKDLSALAGLRRCLRQRMEQSALMDAPRFARDIESAYRRVWNDWCRKHRLKS